MSKTDNYILCSFQFCTFRYIHQLISPCLFFPSFILTPPPPHHHLQLPFCFSGHHCPLRVSFFFFFNYCYFFYWHSQREPLQRTEHQKPTILNYLTLQKKKPLKTLLKTITYYFMHKLTPYVYNSNNYYYKFCTLLPCLIKVLTY